MGSTWFKVTIRKGYKCVKDEEKKKQVDVVLLLKTRHPCYPILAKLISHVVNIHVIGIINSAR